MTLELKRIDTDYAAQQQRIKARCYHPSGIVSDFTEADVEQSIAGRFEEQVRDFPEHVAVKTTEQEISYEGLNRLANRVARLVLASGALEAHACCGPESLLTTPALPEAVRGDSDSGRPEGESRPDEAAPGAEPVALLIEDDILMIASMLGVLKAGQIMMPLDASMPGARLGEMVHDAGVSLILASGDHLSLAREIAGSRYRVVNLDRPLDGIPGTDPGLSIAPGTPAYIMYTSGSTGRPKGIVHSHRNVLHNVMNYTHNLSLSPLDRITLFHAYSFSSAQVDIFTALLNGATLYPWHVKVAGIVGMAEWMARERVTVLSWSPTPFRHLMETVPEGYSGPHEGAQGD
ncbi:MAG TPA: AMP-binding protein, partial [Anaerolineae bacterium]|nr:AMP-binding protein [Anaerolineae bacterium]